MAESLGMSAAEIRLYDERTENPADKVLSRLGEVTDITVGRLYDALVYCDMPNLADLM